VRADLNRWMLSMSLPALLATQQLPRKATQEVFRYGGANAPEQYSFSASPFLAVDQDGAIYARVAPDAAVFVFDAQGIFVRRIGRRGEGPGEFQQADGHGFIGDTLWVRNWPTPRISLFTKDGSHISTRRTPYDFGRSFSSPSGISGFLPGGRAFADPPSPVLGVDDRIRLPLLIGPRNMQRPDTVVLLTNPRGFHVPRVGSWAYDPMPASPLFAVSSRGSGFVTVTWDDAEHGSMKVRLVEPDGRLRWERSLPIARMLVPRSVRDSIIAVAASKARPQIEAARRRGQPITGSLQDLAAAGLDLPRYYPPARRVVLGVDESVWIEQTIGLGTGSWLVLDSAGRPSFQVQTPRGFKVHEATTSALWGITTDELDVPYMVKLRLVDTNRPTDASQDLLRPDRPRARL
jgi:hypothetical protein